MVQCFNTRVVFLTTFRYTFFCMQINHKWANTFFLIWLISICSGRALPTETSEWTLRTRPTLHLSGWRLASSQRNVAFLGRGWKWRQGSHFSWGFDIILSLKWKLSWSTFTGGFHIHTFVKSSNNFNHSSEDPLTRWQRKRDRKLAIATTDN